MNNRQRKAMWAKMNQGHSGLHKDEYDNMIIRHSDSGTNPAFGTGAFIDWELNQTARDMFKKNFKELTSDEKKMAKEMLRASY